MECLHKHYLKPKWNRSILVKHHGNVVVVVVVVVVGSCR